MKISLVFTTGALLILASPAPARELGLSDAPTSASAEDPGTNFTWALELAPAFGDNPKVPGVKALEDHAFSGRIGIRHNFPSRTYIVGTIAAKASPQFATPQVEGAEVGGEIRAGQRILLGESGDPEDNRDSLDFHALGKVSHGTEKVQNVRRSYSDREVGLEATFSNILWLYRDIGQTDRMKWRAGPAYGFTAGWSSVNSDRSDRDNRALTATGELAYGTRAGLKITASLEYENVRYRHVAVAGSRRVDSTLTGYAGVDLRHLFPRNWSALQKVEIGGEVTNTDSNDDSKDDTAVYLRLKIEFGRTRAL